MDGNLSYGDLLEAVYPVDVTAEHLGHLTGELLPEDLDELLAFGRAFERWSGLLGRWRLWIIAENSD